MRILILGGSGIIGSFMHHKLKKNYFVTSTSNTGKNHDEFYKKLNLNNFDEVKAFFQNNDNYDVIIFLVGLAHNKGKKKDMDEFRKTNVKTAEVLIKVLKNENKIPSKFIFFSTISVYGERYLLEQYDENIEPRPISPYALTKLECENYLKGALDNKKLWTIRPAPVYSEKYLNNIDRRTRIKNINYKVGNGNFKLSLCNISNIYNVIIGIINDKIPYGTYNVSDESNYTYNELLKFRNINKLVIIPVSFIKLSYYLGKITDNIFLVENSIKLMSNNVFSSKKLQKYIKLNFNLIK